MDSTWILLWISVPDGTPHRWRLLLQGASGSLWQDDGCIVNMRKTTSLPTMGQMVLPIGGVRATLNCESLVVHKGTN